MRSQEGGPGAPNHGPIESTLKIIAALPEKPHAALLSGQQADYCVGPVSEPAPNPQANRRKASGLPAGRPWRSICDSNW